MTARNFSEALLILTAGGDDEEDDDSVDDHDDSVGDDDDLPGPSIRLTPSAALMQKRFVTMSSAQFPLPSLVISYHLESIILQLSSYHGVKPWTC